MNKKEWFELIIQQIREISDKEFQKRVWVNADGPKVSSYSEVMCKLYDDYIFESYIEKYKSEIPSSMLIKLKSLNNMLNDYNISDSKTDAEIIEDLEWKKIIGLAKQIILNLSEEKN